MKLRKASFLSNLFVERVTAHVSTRIVSLLNYDDLLSLPPMLVLVCDLLSNFTQLSTNNGSLVSIKYRNTRENLKQLWRTCHVSDSFYEHFTQWLQ